jgi:ABC-type ATPase involved in cell division
MEERPTLGEVRVSGVNSATLHRGDIAKLRRKLGVVFQDFRLLDDRTAHANVAFALEVTGAAEPSVPAKVSRLLTQVGLASKGLAYPKELSGGEQQRVAIARALVGDAAAILADEPTAALDGENGASIMAMLSEVAKDPAHGVLVVTHDPRTLPYASRIIRIEDGRIVGEDAGITAAPTLIPEARSVAAQ